jgi:hypothetical protein
VRLAAGAIGLAFVLGYAGSPVMAQVATPGQSDLESLDTSLPALAVLIAQETGEPAGPAVPPTSREILLAVCRERGYGEECAKTLYGMVWKESVMDSHAVGDHGKAQGYFQIHYKLHKISLACAQDLKCSATWSLGYLERNGYPRYATYAVQCHNGCGVRNGYAAAVRSVGVRKWREAEAAEVAVDKEQTKAKTVKVAAAATGPDESPAAGTRPIRQSRELAAVTGRESTLMSVVRK